MCGIYGWPQKVYVAEVYLKLTLKDIRKKTKYNFRENIMSSELPICMYVNLIITSCEIFCLVFILVPE